MFNEIDFSKIDTSITPPQDDTERQYYYMAKLAEMVALRERELGRRITYCLQTFGCQMNEKQSEVVQESWTRSALNDRKQRMRML